MVKMKVDDVCCINIKEIRWWELWCFREEIKWWKNWWNDEVVHKEKLYGTENQQKEGCWWGLAQEASHWLNGFPEGWYQGKLKFDWRINS